MSCSLNVALATVERSLARLTRTCSYDMNSYACSYLSCNSCSHLRMAGVSYLVRGWGAHGCGAGRACSVALIPHLPPAPGQSGVPPCAVGSCAGPVPRPCRGMVWPCPRSQPPPIPERASPAYRLCRRAPRASPVSRLSRRVECRVARPSPPPLLHRARTCLVSQLRRGALEPARCTGCAAGWSLAPPPPSGQPVSRMCCEL